MARIVEQSRQAIIYGEWPDALALVRTSVIALVILGVGWAVFRRLQARVVEYF
jgi:ABC-type polysaccharide/polyol phosphate export permease